MQRVAAEGSWLVLVFSLPAKSASQRVDVWRRLRRYGAIALPGGGHLLAGTPANEERLQWLATAIRKHKGEASIIRAEAIGDLPAPEIVKLFNSARTAEYDEPWSCQHVTRSTGDRRHKLEKGTVRA